jgi:hypothetical protein
VSVVLLKKKRRRSKILKKRMENLSPTEKFLKLFFISYENKNKKNMKLDSSWMKENGGHKINVKG